MACKKSKSLRVVITSNCNFKCIFCHSEGVPKQEEDSMSAEGLLSFFKEAKAQGIEDFTLTGGEPTLKQNIITEFLHLCTAEGFCPDLTIVSNLSLNYEDEFLHALKAYGNVKINVSLHSYDKDKYHEIIGVHHDFFDKVCANIKKFLAAGIDLKLNIVALKKFNMSAEDILAYVDFVKTLGAKKLKYIELFVTKERHENGFELYENFIRASAISKILEANGAKLKESNLRRNVYDFEGIVVETTKCSCKLGCKNCMEYHGYFFDNEYNYVPCFEVGNRKVSPKASLKEQMQEGLSIVNEYIESYADASPSLKREVEYVDKVSFISFLLADNCDYESYFAQKSFNRADIIEYETVYFKDTHSNIYRARQHSDNLSLYTLIKSSSTLKESGEYLFEELQYSTISPLEFLNRDSFESYLKAESMQEIATFKIKETAFEKGKLGLKISVGEVANKRILTFKLGLNYKDSLAQATSILKDLNATPLNKKLNEYILSLCQ